MVGPYRSYKFAAALVLAKVGELSLEGVVG